MNKINTILDWMEQGSCLDGKLCQVYGCAQEGLAPVHDRVRQVIRGFCESFQKDEETQVVVCSAPGRTELGGNHTDHQRGKVLAASVSVDALACAALNGERVIRISSQGYGVTTVDLDRLEPVAGEENTTAALVRGIAASLVHRGLPVAGFDAYIISDVPAGSGLSSSACYEVLVGQVMNDLFCAPKDKLRPEELAMIGQYAENVYFGKPSGLMDQMACALGGIVTIDFAQEDAPVFRTIPVDFARQGMALCIVDTGADHADLTGDYAAIPEEMRAVAAQMGAQVLSQVGEEEFYAQLPRLRQACGDRAVLRAIHYYGDVRRVDREVEALEGGDFQKFLSLVSESGRSSFMYLQNIATFRESAEQPMAIALALADHLLAGRGAFRVHGGGFAGTIQAFVPLELVAEFAAGMDAVLGEGACKVLSIRQVGVTGLY